MSRPQRDSLVFRAIRARMTDATTKGGVMVDSPSPLDDAIEEVERGELAGVSDPAPVPDADPFEAPPAPPPPEPPKKRGRPVNPNSRRARAGKYAGSQSAKVEGPPPPVVSVDYPKIKPASVAASIKQIDAIIVKMAGTSPLTPEEMESGGEVFAPVLDHYMPLLAEKGGLWIGPFTWVVLAYGPRAYELLDQRQRRQEAQKQGFTDKGAQSGDNGKSTFQPTDRSLSVVGK